MYWQWLTWMVCRKENVHVNVFLQNIWINVCFNIPGRLWTQIKHFGSTFLQHLNLNKNTVSCFNLWISCLKFTSKCSYFIIILFFSTTVLKCEHNTAILQSTNGHQVFLNISNFIISQRQTRITFMENCMQPSQL